MSSVSQQAPQITGSFRVDPLASNGVGVHGCSGSFVATTFAYDGSGNGYASYTNAQVVSYTTGGTFYASRSSSVYQTTDYLRPTSKSCLFYIKY